MLLGILEPQESDHCPPTWWEEVQNFINRAVLLHQGRVANDVTTLEMEESGRSLMDFVAGDLPLPGRLGEPRTGRPDGRRGGQPCVEV